MYFQNKLDIHNFCTTDLQPILIELENLRTRSKRLALIVTRVVTSINLIFIGITLLKGRVEGSLSDSTYLMTAFLVVIFVFSSSSAIAIWIHGFVSRNFEKAFKRHIIQELITFIGMDLCYYHKLNTENDPLKIAFSNSRFFGFSALFCDSSDHICGHFNGLNFKFGKLAVGDGEKNSFRGLFFVIEQSTPINAITLIYPHNLTEYQSRSIRKYKRAKLEDPTFEKIFNVYTSNQVGARMQLTPVVMDKLKKLRNLYAAVPYICFRGSYIYIAIPSNYYYLDVSLDESLIDLYTTRSFVGQILNILDIPRAFCLKSSTGMN